MSDKKRPIIDDSKLDEEWAAIVAKAKELAKQKASGSTEKQKTGDKTVNAARDSAGLNE